MGKLTGGNLVDIGTSKAKIKETVEALGRTIEALGGADELPVTRVKVPAGGGMYFTVEGSDGELPPVNEIEGVIVQAHFLNARWEGGYGEGGNSAPVCQSIDRISGWDVNGMEYNCKTCPYNKMGSAGRGKACKNMARVVMVVEGEALPVEVKVPVMSVDNLRKYVAAIVAQGLALNQVSTRLKLMKATNSGGITYAQIMFTCTGKLDEENLMAANWVALLSGAAAETKAIEAKEGEE